MSGVTNLLYSKDISQDIFGPQGTIGVSESAGGPHCAKVTGANGLSDGNAALSLLSSLASAAGSSAASSTAQSQVLLEAYDPLLVVVIMVKNEAHVMRETLQPFVDAGIDAFVVFDTGSTDTTMEVTREFFEEKGVRCGKIFQEPFIDFASSRNHALQCAEKSFPRACFMLMPDAEWYIENAQGLVNFCEKHKNDPRPSYLVRIEAYKNTNSYLDFYTPRLMRCRANVRFVGAVHEVLNNYSAEKVPADTYFELRTTTYGQEKTRKRWLRDREILIKEHNRNSHDPRTVFYLAQTYACLGDWENAALWYEKRLGMQGWDEENFVARCRLAQVYEFLGDWEKALSNYLKAFSLRSQRIEPLVRLAQHYWDSGEKELCFLFARNACEASYPHSDVLFVEKELYEFTRYDLLGRAAWYVGKYDLGEEAVKQALKFRPDAPHLHSNLAWYMSRHKNTQAIQQLEDEKNIEHVLEIY